jgi:hypothetical protein
MVAKCRYRARDTSDRASDRQLSCRSDGRAKEPERNMRAIRKILSRVGFSALAIALAAAFVAGDAAHAQDSGSVSDYRLPPPPSPTPSRSPAPAGPADPENPIATRPSSAPTASPPVIVLPPAPSSTPPAEASPAPAQRPRPTASQPARPETTAPSPTPSETPFPGTGTAPLPAPIATAPAPLPAPVQAPSITPATEPNWLPWIAGLVAALVLAGGIMALRRRGRNAPPADDAEYPNTTEPAPSAPAVLSKKPAQPRTPTPATPVPAVALPQATGSEELALLFTPESLRISLVYATLKYRIDLSGSASAGPLRVFADMIGAHASVDSRTQLLPDPAAMECVHDVIAGAPAEGPLSFTGDLRLPLDAIPIIRKSGAHFFVPLARIHVIGSDGFVARRVFTVGPPGLTPEQPLLPILLDGAKLVTPLAAREIETARWLALDPAGVAG